jgi:hypothetical protein
MPRDWVPVSDVAVPVRSSDTTRTDLPYAVDEKASAYHSFTAFTDSSKLNITLLRWSHIYSTLVSQSGGPEADCQNGLAVTHVSSFSSSHPKGRCWSRATLLSRLRPHFSHSFNHTSCGTECLVVRWQEPIFTIFTIKTKTKHETSMKQTLKNVFSTSTEF